jgi:hypothetical protein
MTVNAAQIRRVDVASWRRLLVVYNLVMLAVGVPVAVYAYRAVHEFLPESRGQFALSWTPVSVVLACVVVGLVANLVFLLGPLTELGVVRWTRRSFNRRLRLGMFAVWLTLSLLGAAFVWFNFWALPVTMM